MSEKRKCEWVYKRVWRAILRGEYQKAHAMLHRMEMMGMEVDGQVLLHKLRAVLARREGNTSEALQHVRRGLGLVHEGDAVLRSTLHHQMGQVMMETGACEEALHEYRQAKAVLPEGHHEYRAMAMEGCGRALTALEQYDQAWEEHCSALTLRTLHHGARNIKTGYSHLNLGIVLRRVTPPQLHDALRHLDIALSILIATFGTAHRDVAFCRSQAAETLRGLGREDEADRHLREVLDMAQGQPDQYWDCHLLATSTSTPTPTLLAMPSHSFSDYGSDDDEFRLSDGASCVDISATELADFLRRSGLNSEIVAMFKEHEVDGQVFLSMTDVDLQGDPFLIIDPVSRERILAAQAEFQCSVAVPP